MLYGSRGFFSIKNKPRYGTHISITVNSFLKPKDQKYKNFSYYHANVLSGGEILYVFPLPYQLC